MFEVDIESICFIINSVVVTEQSKELRIVMEKRWSLQNDKCKGCGTTIVKHRARGLCVDCYNEYNNLKNRGKRSKRGSVDVIMTESYIKDRYVSKGMSQIDIAKECGCSRQFVNIKMKQYGIVGRTKSSARKSALDAGKLNLSVLPMGMNQE